jgi:hypothetical protein
MSSLESIAAPAPARARAVRLSALQFAALAALLGLALQLTIAWIFASISVDVFGGELATEPTVLLDRLIACLITLATCAAAGAYCARRPGPGAFIFACQLSLVVIPMQALVVSGFFYAQPVFAVAVGLAFLLAIVVAWWLPAVSVGEPRRSVYYLVALLAALTLYTYGALLMGGGLGRLNFDLYKVYEVRDEFLASAYPFSGYLIPWQGYVINPAVLVYGLQRRSVLLVLFGLFLQVALFGMTNFRAFLFLPIVVLACGWLGRSRGLPLLTLLGAASAALLGVVMYLNGDKLLPGILIDRLLMVPAELHYFYYDYFHRQGHPFLMLTQASLSALGTPLPRPVPEMISINYLGMNGSANVGLFADAYQNFGLAGCAIFAVLLALVVRLAESLARGVAPGMSVALIGATALELVNAGLLTTLMTHGLLLALLVLWLLRASRPLRRTGS